MIDFAAARRNMVDCQVRTQDVTDLRIIDAFSQVPREHYVPRDKQGLAYLDYEVPLGEGTKSRRLLKPTVLAKFIQAASPRATDLVLDIAGGTGYSAAIWSRLAGEVIALEDDAALVREAQKKLGSAVTMATGPLTAGWEAAAPYDIIFLNGACEVLPEDLFRQLKDDGRLLCVMGSAPGKATLYLRGGHDSDGRALFDASAPPLPGFARTRSFVF